MSRYNKEMERRVRKLRRDEEKKHLEILNLCFGSWGDEEKWRRRYRQPQFDSTENVIVVEENNDWVGGGTAWFRDAYLKNDKKTKVYVAGDGYVLPAHIGKGVYTTLMQGLNEYAKSKEASLGFGFISIYETPFVALPKYGFVDIFYPKTKILPLNAKRLFSFLTANLEGISIPSKFEGAKVKLAIGLNVLGKMQYGEKLFQITKGKLLELPEHTRERTKGYDLIVKTDAENLLVIFKDFHLKKKALYFHLLAKFLIGQFKISFSLRFLKMVLGLA